MDRDFVRISKFLSLVLRHRPESIGLSLDGYGWADVDDLVRAAAAAGVAIDSETLESIVHESEKKRFTLSDDGKRIKANYGHSIDIDLGLEQREPPELLFHGTATDQVEAIKQEGIGRRGRRYVHLSADDATALEVGRRHGDPVVLKVQARLMHEHGFEFYLSESDIWLTRSVPPFYVLFPEAP